MLIDSAEQTGGNALADLALIGGTRIVDNMTDGEIDNMYRGIVSASKGPDGKVNEAVLMDKLTALQERFPADPLDDTSAGSRLNARLDTFFKPERSQGLGIIEPNAQAITKAVNNYNGNNPTTLNMASSLIMKDLSTITYTTEEPLPNGQGTQSISHSVNLAENPEEAMAHMSSKELAVLTNEALRHPIEGTDADGAPVLKYEFTDSSGNNVELDIKDIATAFSERIKQDKIAGVVATVFVAGVASALTLGLTAAGVALLPAVFGAPTAAMGAAGIGLGAATTSGIIVAGKNAEAGQQFVNSLRNEAYVNTFLELNLENMSQLDLNAAAAVISRMPDGAEKDTILNNLLNGLAKIEDETRNKAIKKIETAIASTNVKQETGPNTPPLVINSALSTAYSGKIAGLVAEQNTASA
ncbi:hypothetical protein NO1_1885 [Candidatus Termititenax aidoneus]|uniref:Uncharacterized protein n=1 Tax=Termititenax aidoneus TaxID=2218524 RepID=A0A388TFD2_TERA1|nr:hypothetical protein NO1_1885 [Candidatus Termititenax aidoneus]